MKRWPSCCVKPRSRINALILLTMRDSKGDTDGGYSPPFSHEKKL